MANKFLNRRMENIQEEKAEQETYTDIAIDQIVENDTAKEFRTNIKLKKKKKELKTVHKTFLITESLNKKYKELAEENDMNENELFIAILNGVFNIEES